MIIGAKFPDCIDCGQSQSGSYDDGRCRECELEYIVTSGRASAEEAEVFREVKVFDHRCGVCNQPTWTVGMCAACSEESERFGRLAMLEALGIVIATAAQAAMLAQEHGWMRLCCVMCRRSRPEADLRQDEEGLWFCRSTEACRAYTREKHARKEAAK